MMLNVDDGYKSAFTFKGDSTFPACDPSMVDVTDAVKDSAGFTAAYQYAVANISRYGIVVLDTATELAKNFLAESCGRRNRVQPEQQDWGFMLSRMDFVLRSLRQLPVTTIVLAHEGLKYNPNTGYNTYGPGFQGQLRHAYNAHFDEVWRMFMVRNQFTAPDGTTQTTDARWLQISPDMNVEGKTRANALHPVELPVLDSLLQRMQLWNGAQ